MTNLKRILFYGTDSLSTSVLSHLHHHGYEVRSVTKHSTTPVYKYCTRHGLPVQTFVRGAAPSFSLKDEVSELGVVASFGDMIPGSVIRSTERGFLNIHPSLIPKYKGAAPLLHTLLNGDTEYGITLLDALPKSFDRGDIIHQRALEVPIHMSGREFWDHTGLQMGETLVGYLNNDPNFQRKRQDLRHATPAPKISPKQMKTLVRVCPHLQTADQIFNISRCADIFKLSPTVSWHGKALKLKKVHLINDLDIVRVVSTRLQPGQFVLHEGRLLLRCAGDKMVLGISRIVLPFKDVQSAKHFYRDQCHGGKMKVFEMLYNPRDIGLDEVGTLSVQLERETRCKTGTLSDVT